MRLIGLLAVLFYSQISYSASTLISDYIFEWSEHADNKFAIKAKHRNGKVLFETAEKESFIELYKRNSAVEETSGFFKVHHFLRLRLFYGFKNLYNGRLLIHQHK